LAGGSSPCGIQFASGTSRVKDKFQFEFSIFVFNFKFLLAKTFAKPHTPPVAFAHTISVGRTVTVFFTTTWETTVNRYQR